MPVWCSLDNTNSSINFRLKERTVLRELTLFGDSTMSAVVTSFNLSYTNTPGYADDTLSYFSVQYNRYAGEYVVSSLPSSLEVI